MSYKTKIGLGKIFNSWPSAIKQHNSALSRFIKRVLDDVLASNRCRFYKDPGDNDTIKI